MDKVRAWLAQSPYAAWSLELASADASFRRYFRLRHAHETLLLMDASGEKGSLAPFIDVSARLHQAKVGAPQIFYEDRSAGFLVIEDFGSTHYLDLLSHDNFKSLYRVAMHEIVNMQRADAAGLPRYDRAFLHLEMDLMAEWFLTQYLHVSYDAAMLSRTLDAVSAEVLSQPQGIFVHRDYHSRNILQRENKTVGIIDYQDAMNGMLTYDLVSLLKDCYIAFDRYEIEALALEFRDMKGLHVSDALFLKWFDFTGLQRHIKVLGIFCRLWLRDGKQGYLNDLPLTLHYAIQTALRYEETRELGAFLETITLP
jgi:N-acetylmuramate 1-kinase